MGRKREVYLNWPFFVIKKDNSGVKYLKTMPLSFWGSYEGIRFKFNPE